MIVNLHLQGGRTLQRWLWTHADFYTSAGRNCATAAVKALRQIERTMSNGSIYKQYKTREKITKLQRWDGFLSCKIFCDYVRVVGLILI